MLLFKVAEEALGSVHCSSQRRGPPAPAQAVGPEGFLLRTACAVGWPPTHTHPQTRPPPPGLQASAGCCLGGGLPRKVAFTAVSFCLGKEVTEYLNKELPFIPVTLWGLFSKKEESLDKLSEKKWGSLPHMGAS